MQKSRFQAEQFVDAARLCRHTINILVMYRSEKYLSVSEPVSKRSKGSQQLCSGSKGLNFAGYGSASSLPVLCCFSWYFLGSFGIGSTLPPGYPGGKGLCDDGDGWFLALRMVEIVWYPVMWQRNHLILFRRVKAISGTVLTQPPHITAGSLTQLHAAVSGYKAKKNSWIKL